MEIVMKKLIITLVMFTFFSTYGVAQHHWYQPKELYSYGIIALAIDKTDNMWALIANFSSGKTKYAIQKFNGQNWITYSTNNFGYMLTEFEELNDIVVDGKNNIIVGGKNNFLLFSQTEQKWKKIGFSDTLDERKFRSLLTDSHGQVWSTGMGYKVLNRDTVNGIPFTKVEPYHEIFRFDGINLTKLYHKSPAFFSDLTGATEDAEANIWVAYQKSFNEPGGLLKHDRISSTFEIVNTPSGSGIGESSQVRTLYIDKISNTLYIGSQKKYYDNSFSPSMLSLLSIPVNNYVNFQLPDSIDVISKIIRYKDKTFMATVGEQGGGLYEVIGETLNRIDFKRYFPEFTPWGFLGAPNDIEMAGDKMWCATSDGIVVLDMNLITSVEEKSTSSSFKNLYPNPVRNGETVTATLPFKENEEMLEAFVTNALGQNILNVKDKVTSTSLKVNTASLSSGMYFLNVKTTQSSIAFPFIVE
jgi:hypothetical protein